MLDMWLVSCAETGSVDITDTGELLVSGSVLMQFGCTSCVSDSKESLFVSTRGFLGPCWVRVTLRELASFTQGELDSESLVYRLFKFNLLHCSVPALESVVRVRVCIWR